LQILARSSSKRILHWAALFTAANVLVKGSQAILVVGLASILSTDSFAEFGVIYALFSAMAAFGIIGLQEITASRLKRYSHGIRRNVLFFRVSGLFLVSGFIGLMLIFPFLVSSLRTSTDTSAVLAAVILGGLTSYGALQANLLRISNKNAASLISSAGIPLCTVLGIAAGGWFARDLSYIFIFGVLGSSIVLCFQIAAKQVFYPAIPRLGLAVKEAINIAPFILIALLGWLSGYGINFFISATQDSVDVATFTLLFTIASASQLIASSVNMAWAPRFYEYFNSGLIDFAETRSRYFSALLVIALALVSSIVVGLLPWLTHLVGGNLAHYGSFQTELAFLMAGYVASAPWWQGQNYFHVSGKSQVLMHLTLWSGGLGMALWILAIIMIGREGIYIGFFAQMCIKAAAMWLLAWRYWRMRPPIFTILLFMPLIFFGLLLPKP
jgi:O-antigen/teichoic acid export membrane protein